MNPGDRVTTPKGLGTLKGHYIDQRWVRNRTDIITWAAVKLDGTDHPTMFHPATIKEATMHTDPEPEPTTPDPEPQPEPEPEPEPEDDDEDSKATRRTITIEDEELVGEKQLVEWP